MSESLLDLGYKITGSFFDRAAVRNKLYEGQRKQLSKVGAFVRRTARTSIKFPRQMRLGEMPPERRAIFEHAIARNRRQGLSPPTLPFAPSKPGEPPRTPTRTYKETILFAYDAPNHSVVIGPVALNGKGGRHIPATLEGGGQSQYRGHSIWIEPRPHMKPALAKEQSKLPALFDGIL